MAPEPDPAAAALAHVRTTDRPRARDGASDAEQAIFDATERLLETAPFADVSVEQILREAKVSRATFYFYFSSKWAVITALLARVFEQMMTEVQPFVELDADAAPRDALHRSIVAGTRLWAAHRLLFRTVHQHWHAVPELGAVWLKINREFQERFATQIERLRDAGEATGDVDPRRLASMLVWSSGQLMFVAGLGVDEQLPDEQALIEPIADLWLAAVFGTPG